MVVHRLWKGQNGAAGAATGEVSRLPVLADAT